MFTISRTLSFRTFQKSVGNITAHINTAYVGTELVARGAKKPDDLRIKWQAPNSPRNFVEQTRAMLHSAMLGYVFSAIDRYLRDLADDRWIDLSDTQRNVLRKAVTKSGGSAYSVTERFECLGAQLNDAGASDGLLVEALAVWRNQIVHEDNKDTGEEWRGSRLTEKLKVDLLTVAHLFHARYGELSIADLIDHLERGKSPFRKDIVAIASGAQNYVRSVDEFLLCKTIECSDDLCKIARREIKRDLVTNSRRLAEVWGRDPEARTRQITAILHEVGFTVKAKPIEHRLPIDFVSMIAHLPSASAVKQFFETD